MRAVDRPLVYYENNASQRAPDVASLHRLEMRYIKTGTCWLLSAVQRGRRAGPLSNHLPQKIYPPTGRPFYIKSPPFGYE